VTNIVHLSDLPPLPEGYRYGGNIHGYEMAYALDKPALTYCYTLKEWTEAP